MARLHRCDVCGKPARIRAKMFMTDLDDRVTTNSVHAQYQRHLDVGECCFGRVTEVFKWHPRMTRAEYQASRRRSAA